MFDILFFFFQAEDGIRDSSTSRGLGDVYKGQVQVSFSFNFHHQGANIPFKPPSSPIDRRTSHGTWWTT